jgi:hypothetical protein
MTQALYAHMNNKIKKKRESEGYLICSHSSMKIIYTEMKVAIIISALGVSNFTKRFKVFFFFLVGAKVICKYSVTIRLLCYPLCLKLN